MSGSSLVFIRLIKDGCTHGSGDGLIAKNRAKQQSSQSRYGETPGFFHGIFQFALQFAYHAGSLEYVGIGTGNHHDEVDLQHGDKASAVKHGAEGTVNGMIAQYANPNKLRKGCPLKENTGYAGADDAQRPMAIFTSTLRRGSTSISKAGTTNQKDILKLLFI